MKIANLKLGADPELFLIDEETNKIIPSYYYTTGDKWNPEMIGDKGHAIQHDNVMIEYCIPPCSTKEDFINENQYMLDYINNNICKNNNLKLSIIASADIDESLLNDEKATTFGCDPDYNAYTLSTNKVKNKANPLLRSCGGHIHYGYDNPNFDTSLDLIKALDLFISIPLVIMEPDSERKKLYGKAGAYRFKSYGVEYRSPSNYWLSSTELMEFVYKQSIKAVEFVNMEGIITNSKDIVKAINKGDKELAQSILNEYNITIYQTVNEQ